MFGYSVIGRLATLLSSSVSWPSKPASTKPAVEWMSNPRRPSDDLPSRRATRSSGTATRSRVEPSTNSPGWRMNGSSPLPGTSTSSVSSSRFCFTSMCPRAWFLNTRKKRSRRRSIDDGCNEFGPSGSMMMRPASSCSRRVRSDKITGILQHSAWRAGVSGQRRGRPRRVRFDQGGRQGGRRRRRATRVGRRGRLARLPSSGGDTTGRR